MKCKHKKTGVIVYAELIEGGVEVLIPNKDTNGKYELVLTSDNDFFSSYSVFGIADNESFVTRSLKTKVLALQDMLATTQSEVARLRNSEKDSEKRALLLGNALKENNIKVTFDGNQFQLKLKGVDNE